MQGEKKKKKKIQLRLSSPRSTITGDKEKGGCASLITGRL
jgi:hypothetical protein